MTDPLADPSTELANLNAENQERVTRLLQQGFPIPPGIFEQIRMLVYLETLLKEVGKLPDAELDYANKASGLLDQMDKAMSQAKIVHPGSIQPKDIDKIIQMRPHGN